MSLPPWNSGSRPYARGSAGQSGGTGKNAGQDPNGVDRLDLEGRCRGGRNYPIQTSSSSFLLFESLYSGGMSKGLVGRVRLGSAALGLVLVASVASCAALAKALQPSRTVSIYVVGAIVAPSKADGEYWDPPPGRVPQWLTDKVTLMINDAAGIGALTNAPGIGEPIRNFESWLLSEGVNSVLDLVHAPDPKGQAVLSVGGRIVGRVALPQRDNTYTPRWYQGWSRVDWVSDLSIRMTLMDSDTQRDDLIGDVVIEQNDLEEALADGKPHYIPMAALSNNQLLFVIVTVTPDNWAYTPPTPGPADVPTEAPPQEEPSTEDALSPTVSLPAADRCKNAVGRMFELELGAAEHRVSVEVLANMAARDPATISSLRQLVNQCISNPPADSTYECVMSATSSAAASACGL